MSNKPNILIRFWQELKRRKVFKVLAMYAGSAFIVIQVIDILTNRLNMPPWIATLAIIILSIGFPVTAILAWIFDLTPQGITKTESYEVSKGKEIVKAPSRRRLKASDIIMAAMAITILILAWPKIFRKDAVERLKSSGEKLSVAVMPFKNMTNDTTWNVWQEGIQQRLISFLSNSGELQVRNKESIHTLLDNQGITQLASFSPAVAGNVSEKLEADFYIYGSIQKAGQRISLDAQLTDTKTGGIIKSFEVSGPSSDEMIFPLSDSLRKKVTDFMVLSKLIKENVGLQHSYYLPKSPDVIRYFIQGGQAGDLPTAISWYSKSLELDSSFTDAAFGIMQSYAWAGNREENLKWILKLYKKRGQMVPGNQLYTCWAYAYNFEPPGDQIKYLEQLKELDDQEPSVLYLLGMTYNSVEQYENAIPVLTKSVEIQRRWGKKQMKDNWALHNLAYAYYKTGQYNKVRKLCKEAEKYDPDDDFIISLQAEQALTEKDTVGANRYIEKYKNIAKKYSVSEADIAAGIGEIYYSAGINDRAEKYFRKALALDPGNPNKLHGFANFLIETRRSLEEVQEIMDKAMKLAKNKVDYYEYLNTKGWALYKQSKYKEALEIIQKAWDEAPFKLYSIRSHLEEVKKAAKDQGLI
jgi:tetratricopeptide (TPR) repeat protein/TolB-like protein